MKTTGKPTHLDLSPILTRNPDTALIIGERNLGKTFTVREFCLSRFLFHKERFCGLARHSNRIGDIANGYFDKILEESANDKIHSLCDGREPRTKLEKGVLKLGLLKPGSTKHEWREMGYFCDIAVKQHAKERTFHHVRNFCFDEAIIEPEDLRYNSYIPDEYANLYSVVNSVTRERVLEGGKKPRVFLLGNAADLINPWFRECGISEVPEFGLSWYLNKTFLLDYIDPTLYDTGNRRDNTLAGRALAHRAQGRMSESNEFIVSSEFVENKPRAAQYECGFIYRGEVFGIWVDYAYGITYVCDRFLSGGTWPMYALTTQDNRVNYLAADTARKAMREMISRYGMGLMRFDTISKRERFCRMMRDFGVR